MHWVERAGRAMAHAWQAAARSAVGDLWVCIFLPPPCEVESVSTKRAGKFDYSPGHAHFARKRLLAVCTDLTLNIAIHAIGLILECS